VNSVFPSSRSFSSKTTCQSFHQRNPIRHGGSSSATSQGESPYGPAQKCMTARQAHRTSAISAAHSKTPPSTPQTSHMPTGSSSHISPGARPRPSSRIDPPTSALLVLSYQYAEIGKKDTPLPAASAREPHRRESRIGRRLSRSPRLHRPPRRRSPLGIV